jgi:hypothetical protein
MSNAPRSRRHTPKGGRAAPKLSGSASESFVKARGLNVSSVELLDSAGNVALYALALTAMDDAGNLREPIVIPAGTDREALAGQVGRRIELAQANLSAPVEERIEGSCHACGARLFEERAEAGHCSTCPAPEPVETSDSVSVKRTETGAWGVYVDGRLLSTHVTHDAARTTALRHVAP